MSAQVETYAGGRLHERPRRFFREGKWLEVAAILASWQEPECLKFTVKVSDGAVYALCYHRAPDSWEVTKV